VIGHDLNVEGDAKCSRGHRPREDGRRSRTDAALADGVRICVTCSAEASAFAAVTID
jgi:hypothetical protein